MGLYLKDKKVSPAIYTTSDTFKIHPPYLKMDWDNDELYVFNRVVNPPFSASAISNINGTEKTHTMMDGYEVTASGTSSYKNLPLDLGQRYGFDLKEKRLSINQLGISETGKYDIKLKYTNIEPRKYAEDIINLSSESDYSDILHYERWNYNINLDETLNTYYKKPLSGILNNHKYCEGKLQSSGKTALFTNSKESQTYGFDLVDDNILVSTNAKQGSSFSYAKITFTLEADTEIILKCRSYGESNYDYGILSKIDVELAKSTSDDGATGSTKVLYNFKGKSKADWVDVSFGTVSAGEHFFTIKYIKDSSGDQNDDNFKVQLPDIFFQLIDSGKYLPLNITVENSNYPEPEYEYDPYTGEFKIPMTGNITMTAIAIDTPLLSKLSITPATWDVSSSTLTWDYSVEGATYHIQTPDGQEYTTTEKSFDFTGKLGEPTAEYKLVKIWATKENNQSGVVKIKLIYNPGFSTIHNSILDYEYKNLPDNLDLIPFYEDKDFIYGFNNANLMKLNKKESKTQLLGFYWDFARINAIKYFLFNNDYCFIPKDGSNIIKFNPDSKKTQTYSQQSFGMFNAPFKFGDYLTYRPDTYSIGFFSFLKNTFTARNSSSNYTTTFEKGYLNHIVYNDTLYIICKDSSNKATVLEIKYNDIKDKIESDPIITPSNIYTHNKAVNNSNYFYFLQPFPLDNKLIIRCNNGDSAIFDIKTKEFIDDIYEYTANNIYIYSFCNLIELSSTEYLILTGDSIIRTSLNTTTKKIESKVVASNLKTSSNLFNGKIVATQSNDYSIKYFLP